MADNSSDPSDSAIPLSREARLAAKLRENLRRRKTQARGIAEVERAADGQKAVAIDDSGALSKSPGKS